ncbi:hypothetical protein [Xylanibacter caecicola]|uniref:hypothetical protein n=1 Tax=Xylanibacter caecicola TaxID=2736294 RepID=UPI00258ADA1B|nr:hypothetical protein [Xylanibacter caecicola]
MTRTIKDYFQYVSASMLIVSGVVLTFICFFVNGDVSNGVLCYMAQALTFAGGVFGVSLYFHTKLVEFKSEIKEYIDKYNTAYHENCQ